jgi:ribosomal protein S18 acetylase RimI-like enzyme
MVYVNELYHHGIKGQKWGIRRFQNRDGSYTQAGLERRKTFNASMDERQILQTRNRDGSLITLEQCKKPALARLIAKGSSKITERMLNSKDFDILVNNEKIGDLELYQESPTSVNVTWIGTDDRHRGKGYATSTMLVAIDECKKRGYKQMTLEVPGNSPDARHIYEKLGFVAGKQISEDDDVWGGLTAMKLDLTK